MSLKALFITYLIGGLTLPPLLTFAAFYLLFKILPEYVDDEDQDDLKANELDDLSDFDDLEYKNLKMTELEEKQTSGVKTFKVGWITVTREYHTFVTNANEKHLENKENESKSAYTALYRLIKNNKKSNHLNDTVDTSAPSPGASSQNPEKSMKKAVRRKNRYFGVLKHGNLFLYKDENQQDVQHVIVLSYNIVTLWPRDLADGELFTKRSAICILKRNPRRSSGLPPKHSSASLNNNVADIESTLEIIKAGMIPPKRMGFFIYCDTNYEKEDWYFQLIKATKRDNFQPSGTDLDLIEPSIYANALHFKTSDMIDLIQTLHSSEGQLQTRWLNALIGRIFLSLQSTNYFENIVRTKLLKKLAKINKPGFLDEIEVKKIDVGNSAPFLSFPRLVELNPDGFLKLSMKFSYTGKLSLQVATKVNINLGSHFKTREVSILLAVTLNKLEGPLIVHVKPSPSTRIWYTFESMPILDLTIEPIVSQRQITYGMITKVIENKFRDGVKESLVFPHWDDITFFDTSEEVYRGGIWDTIKRPEEDTHSATGTEEQELFGEIDENAVDEAAEFENEQNVDIQSTTEATENDFNHYDDESSFRSREIPGTGANTSRSRSSFTSSISSSARKTTPVIGTSNEQFLSDGSFVSRNSSSLSSPVNERADEILTGSDKERSIGRANTMQFLSEEATSSKKTIANSFKKIGKWYDKKSNGSSSTLKSTDSNTTTKPYSPPEMIQSRRRTHSNNADSPNRTATRTPSNGDLRSVGSLDSSGGVKAAPQAHTFPAKYLYGLDTQAPDSEGATKHNLPSKIPDMRSPYSPSSETSAFHPLEQKVLYPRRKRVEEDLAVKVPDSLVKSTEVHAATPPLPQIVVSSGTLLPPDTPVGVSTFTESELSKSIGAESTRSEAPPPLPTREAQADVPTEIAAVFPREVDISKGKDDVLFEEPNHRESEDELDEDLKKAIQASLEDYRRSNEGKTTDSSEI